MSSPPRNRLTLRERLVDGVRWSFGLIATYGLGGLVHGVRFRRSAVFPRTGPVIVVANHLAITEGLAMTRLVTGHRRYPHFLIMAEVFDMPVFGALMRFMRQIPVVRGTASAADALKPAEAVLARGRVVVLYPEGHLTKDPQLRPGRGQLGAAKLALAHPDVPVIPVGIWGPQPGRRHVWHRHVARMLIGEPVDLSPWAGDPGMRALRDATAAIMASITVLVEELRGAPFEPVDLPTRSARRA